MNFKESLDKPIFKTICKIADQLNFPTYVVGGWVRDLLLKRKRNKNDIDFVCLGSGAIFAEKVSNNTQEFSAELAMRLFSEKSRQNCLYCIRVRYSIIPVRVRIELALQIYEYSTVYTVQLYRVYRDTEL